MSQLLIVVLLLIPVVLINVFLRRSHRKRRREKERGFLRYFNRMEEAPGITVTLQRQLVCQLVILDEVNGQLLVIDESDKGYTHTVFRFAEIKSCTVLTLQQTFSREAGGETETFVSQIGIDVRPAGTEKAGKWLLFYDHVQHNIYQKAELETDAVRLCERLTEAIGSGVQAINKPFLQTQSMQTP